MNYFFSPDSVCELLCKAEKPTLVTVIDTHDVFLSSRMMSYSASACASRGFACERFLSEYDYDRISALYIAAADEFITDSFSYRLIAEQLKKLSHISVSFFSADSLFSDGVLERADDLALKRSRIISKAASLENAADYLFGQNRRIVAPFVSKTKILNYVLRFISRNRFIINGSKGINRNVLICSITPWGVHTLYETPMSLCKSVIVIRDEYKCIAGVLIKGLAEALNRCGVDTVTCRCGACRDCAEHLIVPSVSLAFFTENRNHPYPFDDTGVINSRRFLSNEIPPEIVSSLEHNASFADSLIDECIMALYDALEVDIAVSHLLCEEIEPNDVAALCNRLCASILQRMS